MSWREEGLKRVAKVVKLQHDCFKYVQLENESLASQILLGVLKASSAKMGPVKLTEIVEAVFGKEGKEKLDVVRITMEKTLVKCGIVEKIYMSERDVRYFPVAYRFQEVSRVETSSGDRVEQLVGEERRLPVNFWPLPADFYRFVAEREACRSAISRLEEDKKSQVITEQVYSRVRERLQDTLSEVESRLKAYSELVTLLGLASPPSE